MTEGRHAETERPDDSIGMAIDRVVRDVMAQEAPSTLRARVLAGLDRPTPAAAWWSPVRVACAGAAVGTVLIGAYFAWPWRPVPVAGPQAVVAEAPRPLAAPAPEAGAEARPPVEATPAGRADVGESRPGAGGPRRAVVAASLTEPVPYTFRTPPLVPRLEPPEPIAIDPVPFEPVGVAPITVEPLRFERLVVEPLDDSK